MPIKLKDTDYSQKKQSHKKYSEESIKKKERKLLSKFPLLFRGAVKLQIIEPSWKISASVLNL